MGFSSRGVEWDGNDDYSGGDGGGGMSENDKLYRYRFSIPTPAGKPKQPNLVPGKPATKRVLILDDPPFCLYEHSLYSYPGAWKLLGTFVAICLKRNGLHEEGCPLCDDQAFPSFTGYYPVIDMGQVEYVGGEARLHHETWTDKDGETHERSFQRKILGAKRGSDDKPGVLRTLQLQTERRGGSLKGTIWDVTRGGVKSAAVGDAWEYVDKILPQDFHAYLVGLGANKETLNVDPPVFYSEGGSGIEDGLFNIDADDYRNKLVRIADQGGDEPRQVNQQGGSAQASGAGFGPNGNDDDIPF